MERWKGWGEREGIFEQNGWTDGPGRTGKSERREDVREGKDWSRKRRKRGELEVSVPRVVSCQKEKRA